MSAWDEYQRLIEEGEGLSNGAAKWLLARKVARALAALHRERAGDRVVQLDHPPCVTFSGSRLEAATAPEQAAPMTPSERDKLLSLTATGRAAIARRAAQAGGGKHEAKAEERRPTRTFAVPPEMWERRGFGMEP